jgi:hypothetical protein
VRNRPELRSDRDYAALAAMVAFREVDVSGGKGKEVDISLLAPILSIPGADQAVARVTRKASVKTGDTVRRAKVG